YTDTDANAAIDARVTKAFVDALNVDADTLDGVDSTGFAAANHTHSWTELTGSPQNHPVPEHTHTWQDLTGSPARDHTHDDRYYTETEVDTLLSGKANTSHTHTENDITDLGPY